MTHGVGGAVEAHVGGESDVGGGSAGRSRRGAGRRLWVRWACRICWSNTETPGIVTPREFDGDAGGLLGGQDGGGGRRIRLQWGGGAGGRGIGEGFEGDFGADAGGGRQG